MNLGEAIAHAQGCYEDPPKNESVTRKWTIDPLLDASGYLPREIVPELKDQNNKYPDYSILPNTPYTWYIEAKAWHVALQDEQVIQALNYANHNGKRWVVLSNGQCWRLYDNSIQGVAAEKLVSEVALDDTVGMVALLTAIGKDSMHTNQVAEYAKQKVALRRSRHRSGQIKDYLTHQLINPGSPVTAAIAETVGRSLGLDEVTPQEIVDFFRHRTEREAQVISTPPTSGLTGPSPSEKRERLIEIGRELVKNTAGLAMVRNSGFRITFVPASWEHHPFIRPDNSKSEAIVWMWVYAETDRIKFALEIMPGSQEHREKIFNYAKAHPELFNPGSNTLYPKYSQIYRKELVTFDQFANIEFSVAENALNTNWSQFVNADLASLEKSIFDLLS